MHLFGTTVEVSEMDSKEDVTNLKLNILNVS